jgi:7-cyano-7-deazaguanine synthase in queuosine biosynthesis
MKNERGAENNTGIDRSQEQVAVMFSGGTDSTLAAAIAAETFKKVHLVSFHVSQMSNWERQRKGAQVLIDRYGANKVVHRMIDNDALFRELHLGHYFRDLKKYGLFLACLVCPACAVGMTTRVLVYCRQYGCRYVWDGVQSEGSSEHIYPILRRNIYVRITEFCRDYGVIHESPVYDISRTDHVLYEMGLTDRKQLKLRALGDADMQNEKYVNQLEEWHKTQADCVGNTLGLIYLVGAFLPRYGNERNEELSQSYFTERIEMARRFLDRYFAGEPVPFLDIPQDSAESPSLGAAPMTNGHP